MSVDLSLMPGASSLNVPCVRASFAAAVAETAAAMAGAFGKRVYVAASRKTIVVSIDEHLADLECDDYIGAYSPDQAEEQCAKDLIEHWK